MANPFANSSNSATISTTERSLPANTTSGVPTSQTNFAKVVVVLDLSAMAAGDAFRCKIYEKVNAGTQRVMETFDFVGAQPSLFKSDEFWLAEGWDVTLIKVAGTDRAIGWSLREDDSKSGADATAANQVLLLADTSNTLAALGILKMRYRPAVVAPPMKLSEATAARRRITFVVYKLDDNLGERLTGLIDSNFRALMSKNSGAAAAEAGTFSEVDAGNMPGVYSYEFTTGEINTLGNITLEIEYFAGVWRHITEICVPIVAYDPFDTVRLGLTALPNAAAEAAGGLYTRGTGAGQVRQATNGEVDVNVKSWQDAATLAVVNSGEPRVRIDSCKASVIDATAIATDAIGSAELAASAVTEIQTGLATAAALAVVQGDTDDIQTRLPAALVGGRMDSSVGAMAANVITAAATAADFGTEIAAAIWTYAVEGTHTAEQYMRVMASALFGKLSGVDGATRTYRDTDDTKDRIVATVDDTGRTVVTKTYT